MAQSFGATVTPVNDAPVVATTTSTPLAYTENAAPTVIDSNITLEDVDSTNLAGATVSISSGFASGEDILAFSGSDNITGNYDSSTGILTLTGSASIAEYQTALREITYENTSDNPAQRDRTISFVVNDGTDNSTAITRNINITSLNDAPTDIFLSNTSINENSLVGTLIANLNTSDVDNGDTHTYQFYDNGSLSTISGPFRIVGNQLQVNDSLDYETTPSYSFTIRSIDAGGDSIDKPFTISINDIANNIVNGTNTNETIVATNEPNIIDAGGGNDTITTTIANLLQNNTLNGGDGTDTFVVEGGSIRDTLTLNLSNDLNQLEGNFDALLTNFENIDLRSFAGSADITGNNQVNRLIGGDGNDSVNGLQGNDSLYGDAGNDTLTGDAGNDRIVGGGGNDSLEGGSGNDTYYVENTNDSITENLDQGVDTVKTAVDWTLSDNVENLTLTGTSNLDGTGNELKNSLVGNIADNLLSGGSNDDSLYGLAGNDTLLGGAGNDRLIGGLGDDSLEGGLGNIRDKLRKLRRCQVARGKRGKR